MKHLVVSQYGTFLGTSSERIVIKQGNETQIFPLNRLRTVSIAKRGVSISSDLIEEFSVRGIKLFFLDYRGVAHSAIVGQSQHGVVAVRQAQMQYCMGDTLPLSIRIVVAKIKNQRAVLKQFAKYHRHPMLESAAESLQNNVAKAQHVHTLEKLLGLEGASSHAYFRALRHANLFTNSFKLREGRGSDEINNSALNLGYAILSSYILNSVVNAGLEPYLGIIHSRRPGKMSLVLDLMEEYRAWVVDRAVIKLRSQIGQKQSLDSQLKKAIIQEVQNTCSKKYPYRKKKHKLEHIMQRQIYRLCGHFYGESNYKSYLFRW